MSDTEEDILSFERTLAFHCAPTLVGLKPANLITNPLLSHQDIFPIIPFLRTIGIEVTTLQLCPSRQLLLIYNEKTLYNYLSASPNYDYLIKLGYPMDGSVHHLLDHLKIRIHENKGFPHEVGLFLGYPLDDVHGFIINNGQNCKLCGYWKVYGDEDQARCLFDQYTQVRDHMTTQIDIGKSLPEVLTHYLNTASITH